MPKKAKPKKKRGYQSNLMQARAQIERLREQAKSAYRGGLVDGVTLTCKAYGLDVQEAADKVAALDPEKVLARASV